MAKALYRKYRSKSLDEVVGQNHITQTLKRAIKNGRIRHAYLFSGPKGVGKTSVARILAHEVNQLPYDDEQIHLDIIEIDAASNRRIDEVRDLRDKVNIAPTSSKYKVYIIDEVHMLTREAFNALLKTLEEPPEHVIFILATTEAHKLPETIISRTQHFTFKSVPREELVDHLADIAKAEKIKIDQPALKLVAEFGQGSVRDSLGLLDQLGSDSSAVKADDVRNLVGLPTADNIERLLASVRQGEPAKVLALLNDLDSRGTNPGLTAKLLSKQIRHELANGQAWGTELLRGLLEVPVSSDPRQALEIELLDMASASSPHQPSKQQPEPRQSEAMEQPAKVPEASPGSPPPKTSRPKVEWDKSVWPTVLDKTKADAPSLYSALRLASPQIGHDELVLAFEFPLHQKKVMNAKSLDLLGSVIESLTGRKLAISSVIQKPSQEAGNRPPKEEVESISNIFGGAEVLES